MSVMFCWGRCHILAWTVVSVFVACGVVLGWQSGLLNKFMRKDSSELVRVAIDPLPLKEDHDVLGANSSNGVDVFKKNDRVTCLQNAADPRYTTFEFKFRQHAFSAELGIIIVRDEGQKVVCGCGDVFLAFLVERSGTLFARPRVLCDGSGTNLVVVNGSIPRGSYVLSIEFQYQVKARHLPVQLPGLDNWEDVTFRGLDDAPTNPCQLYSQIRHHLLGPGLNVSIDGPIAPCFDDWVSSLKPCKISDVGSGTGNVFGTGRWVNLRNPDDVPCDNETICDTSNLGVCSLNHGLCEGLDLLLPDAIFHHRFVEAHCYYPIVTREAAKRCLARIGTISMTGDSTMHGDFYEALHMFAGYQRRLVKGRSGVQREIPSDKREFCRQTNHLKPWVPIAKVKIPAIGKQEAGYRRFESGGQLIYNPLRAPPALGLSLLTNPADGGHARRQTNDILKKSDLVVFQSCGHDICHNISKYRADLRHLGRTLLQHNVKRFVWLSCKTQRLQRKPPFPPHCGNIALARILDNIAKQEISLFKIPHVEFVDVSELLIMATAEQIPRTWWRTHHGQLTGDIHYHEHVCPTSVLFSFGRMVMPSMFYGGPGYLAKTEIALLFHRICQAFG